LQVFDRRSSVLCVAPAARGFWHWVIYDGRELAGSFVTKIELEVMLAAWLSPLEPPSAEQLAELA
jgi:hypothetical protein